MIEAIGDSFTNFEHGGEWYRSFAVYERRPKKRSGKLRINQRANNNLGKIKEREVLNAQVKQMEKEEVNLENENSSLLFRLLTKYVKENWTDLKLKIPLRPYILF